MKSLFNRLFSSTKPSTRRPAATSRLAVETLEDRTLMSATAPLGEFHVNTKTGNDQYGAVNASSSNGRSVVVWTDRYSSTDTDIKAQIYDAHGNRVGGEIVIANSSRDEYNPAVAMDANGNFVVAWTYQYSATDSDVKVARFSANGARRGSDITVAGSTKAEYDPSVAVSAVGDFVVSYTLNYSSTDSDVWAALYRDSGSAISSFRVASSSKREYASSVARAADGRFAIAYQLDYSATDSDIKLSRYSASGALVGQSDIAVSSRREAAPSVAMDNSGNVVVAYQAFVGSDWDIKARRVTSGGTVGAEISVRATSATEVAPSVAINRTNGNFLVGYQTSSAAMMTEVTASGSVGQTFNLGSNSWDVSLSIDGNNDYFVTYTGSGRSSDSGLGVFGRFGRA